MPLAAGKRFGPYEIASLLGEGGMGEVYKARDTRLDRTVALKVMREASAEQRARFEREGRAVAALHHPHICALYDIGTAEEVDYLVMEYLEGSTLAERLRKGPLPLAQALEYATQIAAALDQAHRAGVVHRDLKPANMMIAEGGVKLLDFGLAKLSAGAAHAIGDGQSTLTAPFTAEGTMLGTLPYMAPEQVEGKAIDARTDIFAFGAVLYEMLSGRRAFPGKSMPNVVASILMSDPPALSSIQPRTPLALDRVIQTALAKNPEDRWQSARDMLLALKAADGAPAAPAATSRTHRLPWAVAALLLLTTVGVTVAWLRKAPAVEAPITFTVHAGEGEAVLGSRISPDGEWLALRVRGPDGKGAIHIRSLASLATRRLDGTESSDGMIWSPDSEWLAFVADGTLKKIRHSGGPAIAICPSPFSLRGAWGQDNIMVFAGPAGLYRVAASGGSPQFFAKGDHPAFLPDGRTLLYGVQGEVHARSLDAVPGTEGKRILVGTLATYAPGKDSRGHLIFRQGSVLIAQPFDEKRLEVAGEPFPVASPAYVASVSDHGTLVYTARGPVGDVDLTWYDRSSGKPTGKLGTTGAWRSPALSPMDSRVAAELSADPLSSDIQLVDSSRGVAARFSFTGRWTISPVWSPDGRQIVYSVAGTGGGMFRKSATASSDAETLTKSDPIQVATDWSRDGRYVLYTENAGGNSDLWVLSMAPDVAADRKPVPYLATEFGERWGRFSPDGAWVAYVSNSSKRDEVFVESFPRGKGKWQISSSGGSEPRWRRDGKELFYVSPDGKLMAAAVKTAPAFEAATPVALFSAPLVGSSLWAGTYDAAPDGSRFLLATSNQERESQSVVVMVNWLNGLQR